MTHRAATRLPRRITMRATICAAALTLIGACVPMNRHHGFIPTDQDLADVVIGKTTEAELDAIIGKPSAQGMLTGSGWYFVGSTYRHYGAMKPQEINRQVLAVSFDSRGTVSNIERFGLEDGRVITLSRRVTDSGVSSPSALRQILGNIGSITAGQIID